MKMISSITYEKALKIINSCNSLNEGVVYSFSNIIHFTENKQYSCWIHKEHEGLIELSIAGNNYTFIYLKGNTIKTELDVKKKYLKIYVDKNEITLGINN